MDQFALERDEAGVLVSFHLPSAKAQAMLQEDQVIEINFKELFKKLTGRKRNSANPEAGNHLNANPANKTMLPGSNNTLSNNKALDAFDLRPSNRFESIIDKLERKYYALSNYQNLSDNEELSSSKSSSPSSSFTASPYHTNNTKTTSSTTTTNKRKKKIPNQDYDYSDPFIDDTEAVGEIEEVLHMKRMKTVHEGYFVSSGQLEVTKAPKTIKPATKVPIQEDIAVSANKASSSSEVAGKGKSVPKTAGEKEKNKEKKANTEEQNSNKEKVAGEKEKEKSKEKVVKEKSKDKDKVKEGKEPKPVKDVVVSTAEKDMEVSTNLATELNALIDEGVAEEGKTSMEQDGGEDKEDGGKKVKVEKPLWCPSPEATLALEVFRKFVIDSNIIVSKKSNFPKEWELALCDLEAVVLTHHSVKDINRTRGYYETIQEVVGSQFTAGKLKSIILRTNAKDKARSLKMKIDQQIQRVCDELRLSIIECPDNKQPGSRPRKTKSAEDKGEDDDDNNAGEEMPSTTDALPLPHIAQGEGQTENNHTAMDVDNTQASASSAIMNPSDPANTTTQPQARFKWYCKWSIPTRQSLIDIEDCCEEWVSAENKYREKLSIAEKREIGEEQTKELTVKDEIAKIFQTVCAVFPESCLHGDVSSIKKQIATERRRQKPKRPSNPAGNEKEVVGNKAKVEPVMSPQQS